MKRIASFALVALVSIGGATAIAQTPPAQMPMMQNMPEQCRTAMQNMPAGCMDQMRQHMTQQPAGGAHAGHGDPARMTEASKAYMEAMDKMHGPMMEGARDPDADVAFVKGMIPHHQGAIDMARIVLRHGKDAQIKKLANEVIRAQTREIAEMEAWLKKHAHKH